MVAPEDEDESSKTEEASEHKKQKAKEEGNVALSQDAKSFIMLLGMLVVIWLILPLMGKWYINEFIKFIETPEQIPTDAHHLQIVLKNVVISFFKVESGMKCGVYFKLCYILKLIRAGDIEHSNACTSEVCSLSCYDSNWTITRDIEAAIQWHMENI